MKAPVSNPKANNKNLWQWCHPFNRETTVWLARLRRLWKPRLSKCPIRVSIDTVRARWASESISMRQVRQKMTKVAKARSKEFLPLRIISSSNSCFKLRIRRQNSLILAHLCLLNRSYKSKIMMMVKKAVKVIVMMITRVFKKCKSCQIARTIGCQLCARLMFATKRQTSSPPSTSKETSWVSKAQSC